MADPYSIVRATVGDAFKGPDEVAQNRLLQSNRALNDANDLARRREERAFQTRREEDIHDRNRRELEQDRVRSLRLQLAALMPPGAPLPENMTEDELVAEIASRSRSQKVEYAVEDQTRQLQFEIEKAAKLDESAIRRQALAFGIDGAETKPISELRSAVASAKVKESLDAQAVMTNEGVRVAKESPLYQPLRRQLGSLVAERSKALATYALPEPAFDPNLTTEDTANIYRQMLGIPEVASKLASLKNGAQIIASMQAGASPVTLLASIPEKDREALTMTLSQNYDKLAAGLANAKGYQMSKAAEAYVARLRALPSVITGINRRIEDIYDVGAKSGINFGLALRFEDPDALLMENAKNGAALGPGEAGFRTGEMPPVDAVNGPQPEQPTLPPMGAIAPPSDPNNLFSALGGRAASSAGWVAKNTSEILAPAGKAIAEQVGNLLDDVGNHIWRSAFPADQAAQAMPMVTPIGPIDANALMQPAPFKFSPGKLMEGIDASNLFRPPGLTLIR